MEIKSFLFFFICFCCKIWNSFSISCSEDQNVNGNLPVCDKLNSDLRWIESAFRAISSNLSKAESRVLSSPKKTQNKTNVKFSNINKNVNNGTRLYYCHVDRNEFNNTRSKRYVLQGGKWKKLELTWAVIRPSSKSSVSSVVDEEFKKALEVWSKHSKLTFQHVSPNAKVIDIKVGFHELAHGDKYDFDGKGNTLAHAFYPGGGDLSGDVHFDDAEDFQSHSSVVSSSSGTSLFITAAHELGHSLGLRHSNEENSLMAPYYKAYDHNFELPHDDQIAIQSLYGRPEEVIPRLRPKPIPPTMRPTTKRPVRPPTRPPPRTPRPTLPRPTSSPDKPTHYPHWPTHPPIVPTLPPYRPTEPPFIPTYIPTLPPILPHQQFNQCPLVAPSESGKPDICSGEFDAVSKYGQEIYFFKDKYVWRVDYSLRHREFQLYQIDSMFHELKPFNITKVDAAYSKVNDEGLVLIVGKRLFVIGMNADKTSNDLTLLNMGINATHIDAAWTWGHNGHVYLLSGNDYWRLGKDGKAQGDYPRDSAVWRGLPANISAAFTHSGVTYFFSGNVFWPFDNRLMWAKTPSLDVASFWFGCPHYEPRERKVCSAAPSIKHFSYIFLMTLILQFF